MLVSVAGVDHQVTVHRNVQLRHGTLEICQRVCSHEPIVGGGEEILRIFLRRKKNTSEATFSTVTFVNIILSALPIVK